MIEKNQPTTITKMLLTYHILSELKYSKICETCSSWVLVLGWSITVLLSDVYK